MSKIIENPSRLINAFTTSFGECHRDTFERVFSQYISDVVIAVTAEDIAAQAIAWASSHPYKGFDIDTNSDRYVVIKNAVIDNIDSRFICDYIEKKWDANASTSGDAIEDALLERYTEDDLFDLVLAIVSGYKEIRDLKIGDRFKLQEWCSWEQVESQPRAVNDGREDSEWVFNTASGRQYQSPYTLVIVQPNV